MNSLSQKRIPRKVIPLRPDLAPMSAEYQAMVAGLNAVEDALWPPKDCRECNIWKDVYNESLSPGLPGEYLGDRCTRKGACPYA